MDLQNDIDMLNDVLYNGDGEWDWNGPLPGALGRVVSFVEAIPKDRLNPWHTVTLDDTGWHLAHPITCELSTCMFDGEAREWREAPAEHGVYRWDTFDGPMRHSGPSDD